MSSSDLRVEERIPGVVYVIRLRKGKSGWLAEILFKEAVEKSIPLASLDQNVLATNLKQAFKELEAFSVTEIQSEVCAQNLIYKISQAITPSPSKTPPGQIVQQPAPQPAQPQVTYTPPTIPATTMPQEDLKEVVAKLIAKMTELATRVANLEAKVAQIEARLQS